MNQSHAMDFTGRAVLVTGGTRGLGAALARAFLASGADVMVCGRGTPAALPSSGGREASFRAADLRDPEAAADLVAATAERFGRLDVLVNNAGGSPDADAATVSPRFVEKVVALNLLAPFYTAQAANLVMREQPDGGCVINIGSVSAHDPQPGTAAYAAAKAGLLGLTRALALEWAPRVRVNHITAGLIRTENATALYGDDGGRGGGHRSDGATGGTGRCGAGLPLAGLRPLLVRQRGRSRCARGRRDPGQAGDPPHPIPFSSP